MTNIDNFNMTNKIQNIEDNIDDIIDIFDYENLEINREIMGKIDKYIKATKNVKCVNVKEYINSLFRHPKYKNGDYSVIIKLYIY